MVKPREFCKETVYLDPPNNAHGMTGRDYNKPRQCRRKAGPTGYCWQHIPNYDALSGLMRPFKEKVA